MVMRMGTENINTLGRVTQGVRLIRLKEEHTVATICLVDKEKEEDNSTESEVINNQNSENVDDLGNNYNDSEVSLGNNSDDSDIDLGNDLDFEDEDDVADDITDDLDDEI